MESDYFPIPPPPKATDLDEAYLQISSYLTNWLHKHPKMVRISETKVVTSNGAYVLDELIGFAHQDGIGFGLEYQLVPSFDVCSREQMVNETVSLIQEMTQI